MTTTTTGSDTQSLELVRKGLDAFTRGDIETMTGLLDPNVVFRMIPAGPFQREYRGVENVLGFFKQIYELTGGKFGFSTMALVSGGDGTVLHYCMTRGSRAGNAKVYDAEEIQRYRIRNERLAEIAVFANDIEQLQNFWA